MSPPSPFHNFAKCPPFCTFVSPSILRSSISHFVFCFLPTPTTRRASKKNQYLTPAALGGKEFRWAMHEPMWQVRAVFLFLCYSLWYFLLSYTVCYINPLDARRRYTDFAQTSLRRQKSVYRRRGISTPPPESGILAARYSTPQARSRYTGFVF